MPGVQDKDAYFEGRETAPALVDLYFDRLGHPDTLLDLGCGRGSFGRDAGDTTVVGVDVDRGALDVARTRQDVILADLEAGQLPFESQAFDGFVAKDILEHLDRPTPIVEELSRVLEPGGRGVVSVPMAKPRVVWGDYTHVRGFTEEAIEMLLRDAGFTVVRTTPMGGIPGAGRLGLVPSLPTILRVPGFRRFATSHEVVVEKPGVPYD